VNTLPDAAAGGALLAFDTSTETLALALQHGGRAESLLAPGGAQASARLLPLAAELLARCGADWRALGGIAFGRGPGAFTGLRTSCAVAQGLAFGRGIPVWPIDSLAIVAEDARAQLDAADPAAAQHAIAAVVAMDARMGEVYVGAWRWDAEAAWRPAAEAALAEPSQLGRWFEAAWGDGAGGGAGGDAGGGAGRPVRRVLCGSALAVPALRERWPALPAGAIELASEHDRAAALLRLATQARAGGPGLPAAQALPLYLRDKVAQTSAERAAQRQADAAAGGAAA
jgi:tRNA threonylcarbamoyladenosine biosynthesis protein TsaB